MTAAPPTVPAKLIFLIGGQSVQRRGRVAQRRPGSLGTFVDAHSRVGEQLAARRVLKILVSVHSRTDHNNCRDWA